MTGEHGIIAELMATGAPLSALFISFLVFSFMGWLYESTICALANYGHFANSGFLLGPCCPIYGAGALACWLLLRDIPGVAEQFLAAALVCSVIEYGVGALLERLTGARFWDYALACWLLLRDIPGVAEQFLAAALVCSVIEYGVGALLERLTGARFWDYTKFPFNINGRVCLYGAMLFGAGAVLICRVAEPALLDGLELLPRWVLAAVAITCAALLAIDTVFTLISWRQLSRKLELLRIERS